MILKVNPPAYFFLLLLTAGGLHLLLPVKTVVPLVWRWLGLGFLAAGAAVMVWAERLFVKAQTTVKPLKKPSKLIAHGPFLFSRHPMYLGMVGMLLGVAVLLGSTTPFLAPVILMFIFERCFIPHEEKTMVKIFGKKYQDYQQKVRRWI